MVVITCLTIICGVTFPAFAVADDEWMETTPDDPNISYADYIFAMESARPMPLILTEGALAYGWGLAESGLYATGTGYAVGSIANGGYISDKNSIVDIGPNFDISYCEYEKQKEYNDIINESAALLEEQGYGEELAEITEKILNNESFVVREDLLNVIITALNTVKGVAMDVAGNVINKAPVVDEDELRYGVSFSETFTPASANRRWIVGSKLSGVSSAFTGAVSGSNDQFKWTFYQASSGQDVLSYHVIENKITGAVLTIYTPFTTGTPHTAMSRWYYITDETDGSSFWLFGHAYGSNSTYRTVCAKQGISAFQFSNTGTCVDDVLYESATWNASADVWDYNDSQGNKTEFPLDPLGLILSNTGVNTGGSDAGVVTRNPNKPTDTPVIAPPVTYIPTNDGTVGVPITNTAASELVDAKDVAETIEDEITLDDPAKLKDFIGGFWDSITGLFDWLPVAFTEKLNGVMTSLVAMLVVFVAVFIIDIVWP